MTFRVNKSSDALKYIWQTWMISGMYPVERYTFLQRLHAGLVLIGIDLAWILSLVIKRLSVDSFEQFLDNIPMDFTAMGCFIKLAFTLKMHWELTQVTDLIDELDRRVLIPQHRDRIARMIKFCQQLFIFFVGCYFISGATNAFSSYFRGQRLFHEAWFPFDWRASSGKYAIAFSYQYVVITFLGVQVAVFDVCVPTYLIVLTEHLEFLMERTKNIYQGRGGLSIGEDNYEELVACIKDHRNIMRIFNILQRTIAIAIFFQFASTSLVIVTQSVDIIVYHPSPGQIVYKIFFISAVIFQILPCCYFSNEFTVVSDRFVTSIYSCDWWLQSPKFKSTMIIFMQMTQERKILLAAKIVPVTLATFVSIMKMTYSLATLALNFQK